MSTPLTDERLAEIRSWVDSFDPSDGFEPTGIEISRDMLAHIDHLTARVANLIKERDAAHGDLAELQDAVVEQGDRCTENPDGFCSWHGFRFDECPFEKAWADA